MKYFTDCKNVAETKSLYRSLAFKFHPDHGGDVEKMKALNNEYHAHLKALDGSEQEGTEYAYKYNKETEQEIMEKIYSFLALKMEKVEIALVGTWIWISGDTFPHKKALKEAGCKWHGKRKMWYWKKGPNRRYASKMSFEDIAKAYGFKSFRNDAPAAAMA